MAIAIALSRYFFVRKQSKIPILFAYFLLEFQMNILKGMNTLSIQTLPTYSRYPDSTSRLSKIPDLSVSHQVHLDRTQQPKTNSVSSDIIQSDQLPTYDNLFSGRKY